MIATWDRDTDAEIKHDNARKKPGDNFENNQQINKSLVHVFEAFSQLSLWPEQAGGSWSCTGKFKLIENREWWT